jgi:hypothetical protein
VEAAARAVVTRFSLNAEQAAVVRATVPWFAKGGDAQARRAPCTHAPTIFFFECA